MSVAALAVVLAKLWQFRRLRLSDRRTVEHSLAAYRRGDVPSALATLDDHPNPVAQTVAAAIRFRRDRPDAGELQREEALRQAGVRLEALRSHLRVLDVIATLSPLLGLFGTVLGMIDAFQEMAAAGNQVDPSVLSGGIWEALMTTAVGLGVAIPATAAASWLDRRVERATHAMEDAVTQVFTAELAHAPDTHDTESHPRHARAYPAAQSAAS
nr:MotA/TolQ/ExbB proton channel family protein [Rhodovibrio salinarum]